MGSTIRDCDGNGFYLYGISEIRSIELQPQCHSEGKKRRHKNPDKRNRKRHENFVADRLHIPTI